MRTSHITMAFFLATGIGAACSSSINALSQDGGEARDVSPGSGGSGPIGTGGTAGMVGLDAGAGGSVKDAQADVARDTPSDTPASTGGRVDAGRDLGPLAATGGAGVGGAGRGGSTGQGGSRPDGGGIDATGGIPGTGGATGGSASSAECSFECRTVGDVTGWYAGDSLICAADCTGCTAICRSVGTRSEGCYASCSGRSGAACGGMTPDLIRYTTCGNSYPTAYLAWQAPLGDAGTGPALAVNAAEGKLMVWDNTAGFSPETPPTNPTESITLSTTSMIALFSALEALDLSSIPHAPFEGWECYPRLYFRLCSSCAPKTLEYALPESISPEMEPVWSRFENLTSSSTLMSPRSYCALPSSGG